MGLFINNEQHKNVFKATENIKAPQQLYYRSNHLSELLQEQRLFNQSMKKTIHQLNMVSEQQRHMQTIQWNETKQQLQNLYQQNEQQDTTHLLKTLEQHIHHIMQFMKDDRLKQHHMVQQSYDEIMLKINDYATHDERILEAMDKQRIEYQKITDSVMKQEKRQEKIDERLEKQEALTEKLVRQVDHLRSVIYERVNYLAGKLDTMYKDTSTYMSQLLTKATFPMSSYMFMPKDKQSKGNSSYK